MQTLINELVQDSDQIAKQYADKGTKNITALGISMGSVMALMLGKQNRAVKNIILVTVYGSAVKHIYDLPKLAKVKQLSFGEDENWQAFSAKAGLLESLKGKKLTIFVSKTDGTILFKNTKLLLDTLDSKHIPYRLHVGRGSHIRFTFRKLYSKQLLSALLT